LKLIKSENLHLEKHRTKSLFIGRSGSGKSEAGTSFPGPIYWMCTDDRLGALQGKSGIDIDIFNAKDGFTKVEVALENNILRKPPNQLEYKTVVLATVTSISRKLMYDSLDFIGTKDSGGDSGKGAQKIGNLTIGGLRNYLYVQTAWQQIIYNGLMLCPTNVIVEAHLVNNYDDKLNVIGERVLASDKLSEEIPSCFDEVWEFKSEPSIDVKKGANYYVRFHSPIARSSLVPEVGKIDWTGKNFYNDIFLPRVKKEN
jgi:hypothetical protein